MKQNYSISIRGRYLHTKKGRFFVLPFKHACLHYL